MKVPSANRQVKEENANTSGKDLAAALERIAVLARLGEEQKDQISHSQIQHEMVRGRSLILISSHSSTFSLPSLLSFIQVLTAAKGPSSAPVCEVGC